MMVPPQCCSLLTLPPSSGVRIYTDAEFYIGVLLFLWEINTHLYLSHPRQLSVVGAGAVQDAEGGAEAGEPENKKKE